MRACAVKPIVEITPGAKDRAAAADLVGNIRRSEIAKDKCGRNIVIWYDELSQPSE